MYPYQNSSASPGCPPESNFGFQLPGQGTTQPSKPLPYSLIPPNPSVQSSSGFTLNAGFPQAPSNPGYPPASSNPGYPNSGYPNQGYPNPGYPPASSNPGYPPASNTGYPQAPGYPPASSNPSYQPTPQPAFNPNYTPSNSGYPLASSNLGYPPTSPNPGYPPASLNLGYPPASSNPGYPPASSNPGYPPASSNPGYPPASSNPGYPPTTSNPGYPPSVPNTGYPSAPYNSGYPSTPSTAGFAPGSNAYPSSTPSAGAANMYPNVHSPTFNQSSFNNKNHSQTNKFGPHQHHKPTLYPAKNFDPSSDAAKLKKAMKGWGTDEGAIIEVLGKRTDDQRQRIATSYKQAYGKDLKQHLDAELSGNFCVLAKALVTPIHAFLASQLHKAMDGLGTDETTLIDVLCTRTNAEITLIKETYKQLFKRTLESDVKGDTSYNFKRLLVSMVNAGREESDHNIHHAPKLAQELYKAGQAHMGTDESTFNRILCTYSFNVTRVIFDEYRKIKGLSLYDAIKREFSGDIKDGLLAVVQSIENRTQFYAQQIHRSMAGLGTNDAHLIRLIVTRCEIDLDSINHDYKKIYGHSIEHDIKGDTSGDYKKLLVTLIKS